MQTILGTGGTIGTLLAKELLFYTSKIRLVSRNPQKVNLIDQLFPADLTHRNCVFKAIEGSEVVYVTIGFPYKTSEWERLWNPFIHNVVSACILYRAKLVLLDNIYLYDPLHIGQMTENTPVNPTSGKGKIRARVAEKVTALFENNRCDAIIGRAPDFLCVRNSIIGRMIYLNLKNGNKAMCLYRSDKKQNIIHPSDVAKSLALLGNTPAVYNQVYYFDSSKFEKSFNYQPLTVYEAVRKVIEEDQAKEQIT